VKPLIGLWAISNTVPMRSTLQDSDPQDANTTVMIRGRTPGGGRFRRRRMPVRLPVHAAVMFTMATG
jgi:hypothetical protein